MELLILLVLFIGIPIIISIFSTFKENKELLKNYNETRILLEKTERSYKELKDKEIKQDNWTKKQEDIRERIIKEFECYLYDREEMYKWLSPLIADLKLYLKEESRGTNELVKNKRNFKTMTRIENLMREKRALHEENSVLKYRLEYIKTLIPETEDIMEYDEYSKEALEEDNPDKYLTKEEYNKLTDTEKNIKALDYYQNIRKKRNWEIGRDFERFIGYLFEKEDFYVEYYGIEKKINDLGRDLIVKDVNTTLIIQCKYWSKNKTIHEKHIAQLFGTTYKYKIDNPNEKKVIGLFISHTTLSDEAKNFGRTLGIKMMENVELGEYPIIKCNIGTNGDKIYHLPMDQQYDSTIIDKKKGECYALTIEEAEGLGFRRAYEWHGNLGKKSGN